MTLDAIAEAIGVQVAGDGHVVITNVAPIESACAGDLAFVANSKYTKFIETTSASALVLDLETPCSRLPAIRCRNPYLSFAQILDLLMSDPILVDPGISEHAIVEPGALIGEGSAIGPFCHIRGTARLGRNVKLVSSVYVGDQAVVGDDCLLHPGVQVLHGTSIGSRAIIHAGTVIGSDGFGFAPSESGLKKIKQIGWVEIGEDVEIGANVTIDRGALGPTRIGRGTKIDNLVHIAHNVEIGQDCIIVAQVGISGSSKIGNRVALGGQVGLIGHIELGDDVKVGAQSGVAKSVPAGETVFGSPAREIMETKRIEAALARLPELLRRVKQLENELKKHKA